MMIGGWGERKRGRERKSSGGGGGGGERKGRDNSDAA